MKHRPTAQHRPSSTPQPTQQATSQPLRPPTSSATTDQTLFTARGRYTRVLPLSHMVPTFYPSAPGQAQPRSGAPQIQLADADLQARAQRLVNVLYWTAQACAGTPGMDDPQTLKVFITPEFYFRRASPDEVADREFRRNTSFGSYPETDRAALVQALHAAVGDAEQFQDWLIVAGTICSVLPRAPGQRMNLLNSALLLRGPRSEPDGSPPFVVMEKHYISNIDGPPPALHANLDPTTVFSFHLNPDQLLDNIVHWDGLTLGVEVCLDHARQVLVNAMNNLHFTIGPDVPPPDLQLVTSCGMDLVDQAVAVRDGGLVFLTDGMSHAGDGLPEPQFQFARFLADGPFIEEFGPDTFNFHELPETEDYQVRYFHGLYQARGRRQGVWCGQQPLALNEPVAAPAPASTRPEIVQV